MLPVLPLPPADVWFCPPAQQQQYEQQFEAESEDWKSAEDYSFEDDFDRKVQQQAADDDVTCIGPMQKTTSSSSNM